MPGSEPTVVFQARDETEPTAEVSLASIAGANVVWPFDERYATAFFGPPAANIVVRLEGERER